MHARAIRQAVAAGTLPGTKKRGGLCVPFGAFSDWRETDISPVPERGLGYLVLPDAAHGQAERLRAVRSQLLDVAAAHHGWDPEQPDGEDPRSDQALGNALLLRAAGELASLWQDLLALEATLSESTASFDGEEPVHPFTRGLIDEVRQDALVVHARLVECGLDLVLPEEPEPAVLTTLRAVVERMGRDWR
jgi:hypothetical protein